MHLSPAALDAAIRLLEEGAGPAIAGAGPAKAGRYHDPRGLVRGTSVESRAQAQSLTSRGDSDSTERASEASEWSGQASAGLPTEAHTAVPAFAKATAGNLRQH